MDRDSAGILHFISESIEDMDTDYTGENRYYPYYNVSEMNAILMKK